MPIAATSQDKRSLGVLAVILVVAAMLRLPALSTIPPPLNVDEASRGYDAWAILETGADRHGVRWPLFLESFGTGDFTAALTTYITVPFVAVLGPVPLAMRLPDALLGILTVGVLYLWLKRQAGVPVALAAAAILAVDPWHIALCRTAHESGFTPFFLVVALLSLHRAGLMPRRVPADPADIADTGGNSRPAAWALLAGLMLGVHTWAYPATRLFTPLLIVAVLVIYRRHCARLLRIPAGRVTLECLVAGALIGGFPLIVAAVTHPEYLAARARAALLIYKDYSAPEVMWKFVSNYALHLSQRYLFQQCDEMSGSVIPGVGLHLVIWAPLLLIGLWRVAAGLGKEAWCRLLGVWLLLYPLPAAICAEWNPHPMRSVGGMLLFPILAGFGGEWLVRQAAGLRMQWRGISGAAAVAAIALNLAYFVGIYFGQYAREARPGYQTALVEAVQYVARHSADADFVLITNYTTQPYIYVLLYQPIPPAELTRTPIIAAQGLWGFHQVLRVGKFYFAPKDFPAAVQLFQQEWQRLAPTAQGLVIDIERPDQAIPGEVIERIPTGLPPGKGPANLEIRRWRLGEGATTTRPGG